MDANTLFRAAVCTALVVYLAKRILEYFRWRARIDAIGGPKALLLTGTMGSAGKLTIPNSRPKAMRQLVTDYPKMFRLWKGPFLPFIYLVCPETAKIVLDSKATPKSLMMTKIFDGHLGGKSLLIAVGDEWKNARKLFTPAFHFKVLDQYLKEMVVMLDKYLDGLEARTPAKMEETLDMEEELVELYLHILLQSVYSCDSNVKLVEWRKNFINAAKICDHMVGERIDDPFLVLSPNWLYTKYTSHGREFTKQAKVVRNLSRSLVRERIEANKAKGEFHLQDKMALGARLDFLDLCLAHVGDSQDFDLEQEENVISQTTTFSAAGSNTAAAAVSFTLYCLAKNPKYQQMCYEESCNVLEAGETVDLNTIQKFKFLSMCFKESTRLYPPIPRVIKDLEKEIEIDGKLVEPGVPIIVSIYSIHHNPTIWKDPELFDPHRFEPEEVAKRDPYSFLIYSAGQRNCLGQKYADMMTRITIAKVLQRFVVSVDEDYEPQLIPSIILKSANGVMLRLTPRKK